MPGGHRLPLERGEPALLGGLHLQRRVAPDPTVRALAGVATVRVTTIRTDEEPKILRAAWKVPSGGNFADNFWRRGDLLARSTPAMAASCVSCAARGLPRTNLPITVGTKAPLVGIEVPQWRAIGALALSAAASLNDIELMGSPASSRRSFPARRRATPMGARGSSLN